MHDNYEGNVIVWLLVFLDLVILLREFSIHTDY